ncbi:dual oxidase maturation factor 1-like isoform X1 [Diorhabda carinulata]|uniref:dual oxidase maturation factor 1-like isoform X1 n=1 Tax=Diorhabda carinulata TaxID=1163345 RepID=UPI0025A284E4|nr:dual oxidase maturation factor 1-like isoform X1 [Diorhabda carinulata]
MQIKLVEMWFDLGRREGFPTQYGSNKTPVTVDVLDAGFIAAGIILGISFCCALPTPKLKENSIVFIRVGVTIIIGTLLLINNFGQEWEVGHIFTKTPYKAGSGEEINASISLKIGLRSLNVTLKANSSESSTLKYEIINYNERFEWTWDQGVFGFGPYAGKLQREYRQAQYRGVPHPILWVVEYFIIDGEGLRYGRFYRTAGWYTHILMWTAFPCWILSVILFRSVIRYGAYFLGICGGLLLFGNFIYLVIRNPNTLKIHFEDDILTTKFGFHYWCTFALGIFCIILSLTVIFMEYKYDQQLCSFFGVNPLNSYDAVAYLTKEERLLLRHKSTKYIKTNVDIPLVDMETAPNEDDDDVDYVPVYLKRRNITSVSAPVVNRTVKPNRHKLPLPPPPESSNN